MKTVYIHATESRKSLVRLLALLSLFGIGELLGILCIRFMDGETVKELGALWEQAAEGRGGWRELYFRDFFFELRWLILLFFTGWIGFSAAIGGGAAMARGFLTGYGSAFLWSAHTWDRFGMFFSLVLPGVFLTLPAYYFLTELARGFFVARQRECDTGRRIRYAILYFLIWLFVLILFAGKSLIVSRLMTEINRG